MLRLTLLPFLMFLSRQVQHFDRLTSMGLAATCDCVTPWTFHLIFCIYQY